MKSLIKEFWRDIPNQYHKNFPGMISGQYEEERSWIHFKVVSTKKVKSDDAEEFQMKFGKHPAGYGFYSFKENKDGKNYVYTWKCSRSSD